MIDEWSRGYEKKYFKRITFLVRLSSSNVCAQIALENVWRINVRFECVFSKSDFIKICGRGFWFKLSGSLFFIFFLYVNLTCLQAFINFISKWICLFAECKNLKRNDACLWCERRTYSLCFFHGRLPEKIIQKFPKFGINVYFSGNLDINLLKHTLKLSKQQSMTDLEKNLIVNKDWTLIFYST